MILCLDTIPQSKRSIVLPLFIHCSSIILPLFCHCSSMFCHCSAVVQGLFALGTVEVLFDQYVRRMGTETFFASVYMKLKYIFTCGLLKPKEVPSNKGESSTKVKPVQVDISRHMGTLAKKNASREPMRGLKLFKKSAKIMTTSFQRAESSTRQRYEANRRKLKVHFKNAVSQKKLHKEIRNNGSAAVQKSLEVRSAFVLTL